jgi:two-component system, OmpR family, sensor kinase
MNRLPIRLRLSLAFAAAMAVVLGAVGAFVYFQLRRSLDEQLEAGLRAQAEAARAGTLVQKEESVAQVLGADGRVLYGFRPALSAPATQERFAERDVSGLDDGPYRLLIFPAGGGRTVVVGAALEDRNDALGGLLKGLLIGGPIALALATLLGYLLAGALLRPVERMRREAAAISADTAGRRLPLPRSSDEISRLGETLNAMLARLESGLTRERRFVADASHELRTPLALLRTELELARRHRRSSEELRAVLDSAAEEVERLGRLAEDLLVLARVDEGRLPLRREQVRVEELVKTVASRFRQEIDVAVDNGISVYADRLRLEQALGNLVDNALRHGAGAVRLDATRRNGRVLLQVSDEGAGFAPELLPTAFERFTRGDEARDRGGTGLGLAIVEAVARAHGGRARAKGSTVTIELPSE